MKQVIITKRLEPNDKRTARIKCTAVSGTLTFDWNASLNVEENHLKAAKSFAWRQGWLVDGVELVGGAMPDGSGWAYLVIAITSS